MVCREAWSATHLTDPASLPVPFSISVFVPARPVVHRDGHHAGIFGERALVSRA